MDKKVYERTRYQNIYRHKKNKNYVVQISKPVKTTISRIDGKKIFDTETALKIRDNSKIKKQKAAEILYKETFDELWDKYTYWCKYIAKQSYNTLSRKTKTYNRYLKDKIKKPVSKTDSIFWANFIEEADCSIKQKNQILKDTKSCINWCFKEGLLTYNPLIGINRYKVSKSEMKYWLPNELKQFINTLNKDINSNVPSLKKKAYLIKTLTLIGFNLGDRIGETRALTFNCIDEDKETISILHSIDYDTKSNDPLSYTKNYQSQRVINVTRKLINEINNYKDYLINDLGLDIKNDGLIFFNHKTKKPYSDVALRKSFYYYCDKANVPRIRMYDLRHTYVATMMAENQELYNISERIGHNNFNTTVNKYGHLSNEKRKEIAKTTDKYY